MTDPAARSIAFDAPELPARISTRVDRAAFPQLAAIGDLGILARPLLAFFCSRKCPGALILRVYDLAVALRDRGVVVVGGFQTPMEREALTVLLRGGQPIVVCPNRAIDGYAVPAEWREGVAGGRMLLLSPFPPAERRKTAPLAEARNRFAAAVADEILIAHASPGGATERLALGLLAAGRPVLTLDDPANTALLAAGARVFDADPVGASR